MKKNLKKILLYIIMMLICSICSFTYATEEDGRFVDIPVPPDSYGRTDFTTEEAEEQTKEYEQKENNIQINDEKIDKDDNLYNGEENKEKNNLEEENIKEDQNLNDIIENIIDEDNKENIEDINNTDIKKDNKKIIIGCIAIVLIIIIFIVAFRNKKQKRGK